MIPRPFVLDMETSDPDDFLTLLLLLGHPGVDLRAVTITPGTREQVGLVRQALSWFGRTDVLVGAFDTTHPKDCISKWHYDAFPQLKKTPADADDEGWGVLERTLGAGVTMIEGAAPKNLGKLVQVMAFRIDDPLHVPNLGRLFFQGGFAGEGVVPPEKQLPKFRGRTTCPSFNPGGAPKATLDILAKRTWFEDLRFVGKQVCHGVKYDSAMHARYEVVRSKWCGHTHLDQCDCACHDPDSMLMHVAPCCGPCPLCGVMVPDSYGLAAYWPSLTPYAKSQYLIYQGMDYYLGRHPDGKALHDPLAAACAIDPTIGEWAEVEMYRDPRGEWGSYLLEGSGVKAIVGYDHERFVGTLLKR